MPKVHRTLRHVGKLLGAGHGEAGGSGTAEWAAEADGRFAELLGELAAALDSVLDLRAGLDEVSCSIGADGATARRAPVPPLWNLGPSLPVPPSVHPCRTRSPSSRRPENGRTRAASPGATHRAARRGHRRASPPAGGRSGSAIRQKLQGGVVERPGASGDGQPAVAEVDVIEHEGGDLGDPGEWTAARARTSRAAGVVAARTERSTCSGRRGCSTAYSFCPTLIRLVGLRNQPGGPRSLPRREGTVWLFLNQVRPALSGRASNHRTGAPLRGQDTTLERLRADRQLEEALTHVPDPLHLAEVFGLDEKTAMR